MKKVILNNKTALIVAIATVFLLLISAVMFSACSPDVPETKKIDLTFDVVKINSRGEELNTLQLHLTGQYLDYQSQEDMLELDIEDFDSFTNIRMRKENNFVYFEEQQRGCMYFESERSDRTYTETLRMYFSENFDRVVLEGRGETLYIGSGSGKYTAQECISYFEDDGEAWDFVESVNIDMTVDAVRVNDRGYEIETIQLDISGYYRDYILKKDSIVLDIYPSKKNLSTLQAPESTPIYWDELEKYNLTFIQTLVCGYNSATQVSDVLVFMTTDEYDRFIITGRDVGVFYVGSVSGKYTAQEIVAYFNTFTNTGITLPEA